MTTPTTSDLRTLLDTDPAAGLRGVAALMRARAKAATPGPWEPAAGAFGDPSGGPDHMRVVTSGWSGAHDAEKTVARLEYERQGGDDAAHIAAADPPFVLAVADWLGITAEHWSDGRCNSPVGPDEPCGQRWTCETYWTQDRALAVARAYLGQP